MRKIENSNYVVTENGDVLRPVNNGYVPAKKRISKSGKETVAISMLDGSRSTFNVDTLVAKAFLGIPDRKHTWILHKDGDKRNNKASNLVFAGLLSYIPDENVKNEQLTIDIEKPRHEAKNDELEELKKDYEILKSRFDVVQSVINNLIKDNDWLEVQLDQQRMYSRRLEDLIQDEAIVGGLFKKVFNYKQTKEKAAELAKFVCELKGTEVEK